MHTALDKLRLTVNVDAGFYSQEKQRHRREQNHEADIVIVGAGIAGCALAIAFGNQSRSVILLERSLKEPDRIVGELLQPGGVAALEKLGLEGMFQSRRNFSIDLRFVTAD